MTALDTAQPRSGPPGSGPLLEVSDLRVSFPSEAGPVQAVRGVSYTVAPGEVVGIVGESGSGKSVSSLAVMGLLPPSARVQGSALFRGEQLVGRSDRELTRLRGGKVAMVFQDPLSAFTPVYSIGDQIAETVEVHQGSSRSDARKRAVELLDLVGIPFAAERAKAFPHEFSGGMRQRAMIAMAIANDPDLIIADEPTTALDVTVQAQVLEVLKQARDETGAAMVMITHDLGVVAGVADRVLVMYAGRVIEDAPVEALYDNPRMPYTIGLLGSIPRLDASEHRQLTPIEGTPPSLVHLPPGCPFAPRCPVVYDRCREQEPELLDVTSRRDARAVHRSACHRSPEIDDSRLVGLHASADPAARQQAPLVYPLPELPEAAVDEVRARAERTVLLEVDDLKRHYPLMAGSVLRRRVGTVHAVDGLTFDIREGEALGLVGESGCGKTSTITEILELRRPTEGRVVVLGRETGQMSKQQRREVRRDVQVVFQDPLASLDPRLPVFDLIAEPMLVHGFDRVRQAARVRELLSLVGLDPAAASRYPQEFSGGQRQRIAIARALALDPKLVVLDEPVSALDVSIQAGVLNLLERLKVELDLSYLFVAHDLSVVRHIADRVAVMYLGRIVEVGETREVFDRPQHPYTQALLSAIPLPDPRRERERRRLVLTGDLPSPVNVPAGCRFRSRCFVYAGLGEAERQRCEQELPPLVPRASALAGPAGADTGPHDSSGNGAGATTDRAVRDHATACHFVTERSVV